MKILKVIHGYPMRYNAGSEVYSQTLCHALLKDNEVQVFTRTEDSFEHDYVMFSDKDADQPEIKLHIVNMPRSRDGYRHSGVDEKFDEILKQFKPDLVHIGHLNHLSTSIPLVAKRNGIPVVYTLHDYWLMCPRGQFMQMFPEDRSCKSTLWEACSGQNDHKCALHCYKRYFSGIEEELCHDIEYWTNWVSRRMMHIKEVCNAVDLFIAPARYLYERYRDDFGLAEEKLVYLDYGFDLSRLTNRTRHNNEPFTFGYIGTHIPAKGIHQLLEAFGKLEGEPLLKIWGRPRGEDTNTLKRIASSLSNNAGSRVHWTSEYKNQEIISDVFNHIDAIVVPSIWVENSPLVIHEAQQARVPVVTANTGGMSEYVKHDVNGVLFEHRSIDEMAQQMQRMVNSPKWAKKLGEVGYLYSTDGNIPSIDTHVKEIQQLYSKVLNND